MAEGQSGDDVIGLAAGRRGHFRLESGLHGELWLELDALFVKPRPVRRMAAALAQLLTGDRPDAICGPLTGGGFLGLMVAEELGLDFYHAERFAPARNAVQFGVRYRVPPVARAGLAGQRVAIVDDVISAGSAVLGVYSDLLEAGGKPVALGALLVLGDRAAALARDRGLELRSLDLRPYSFWSAEDCPQCRAGIPIEVAPTDHRPP